MRGINTTKLLILAILGFCAVVLGSAVLTLQIYVTREKQRLGLTATTNNPSLGTMGTMARAKVKLSAGESATGSSSLTPSSSTSTATSTQNSQTTIRPSRPISTKDIHLKESGSFPPQGRSIATVRLAFWRQAAAVLQEWDALLEFAGNGMTMAAASPATAATNMPGTMDPADADGSSTDEIPPLIPPISAVAADFNPQFALEQAATAGHPMAQHYLANAHASGIWPVPASITTSSNKKNHTESTTLHVFDEWSPTAAHQGDHPQQIGKAFLLWHMAAIGGNIESAMALAHRISELGDPTAGTTAGTVDDDSATTAASGGGKGSKGSSGRGRDDDAKCRDALPYWEAAAHGIVDQLEASPHSRAKVLPPMDLHILAQVHMHGGSSSQLDWYNKPHESKDAIQFYHLKATARPWTWPFYKENNSNSNGGSQSISSTTTTTMDVHAAYTLAHLYHYGLRGVAQNLTQSLLYYEIAASHAHWESAGEAGTFYLWGLGTAQNVELALHFFQMGAPFELEGCRLRHEKSILAKNNKQKDTILTMTEILECDANSINGLGVLHLLGVPDKIQVDVVMAEKYFALAKEMGSADAMYHLSMMWLGWKTHFKHVHELKDDGVSSFDPEDAFPSTTTTTSTTDDGHEQAQEQKHTNRKIRSSATSFALHYSKRTDSLQKGPTPSEMLDAINLLGLAANKGHLQAKHRLAMIYSEGIQIQTPALRYEAVTPSCSKARSLYQWITENASLQRSRRLRKAYKAYTEGELEVSLRNYLAAAETGSNVGQVNAAFLLEQGTCLGLSAADCAKASVRLWKAASARGNAEACLRVGDFYYYGRIHGATLPVGPFGWVQYLLYPEKYLPEYLSRWSAIVWNQIQDYIVPFAVEDDSRSTWEKKKKQSIDPKPELTAEEIKQHQELLESDLSMAAHYYSEAVEKHFSPRANFNLGFMYEWGLGLKQDFPLAKRHYDLAVSVNNHGKEAELAVQIALWVMWAHEYWVKLQMSWEAWRAAPSSNTAIKSPSSSPSNGSSEGVQPPAAGRNSNAGQPVPGPDEHDYLHGYKTTAQDIILSHICNWSSLAIVVLVYIVMQIRKLREEHRRRRRR